jgi:hypothetical protein
MKIDSNSLDDVDLTDKIVVLKEKNLSPRYRTIDNRLYRVTGGFGARIDAMGRAIFAECLGDGTPERFHREELEGWLTEEETDSLIKKETGLSMKEFLMWAKLKS